MGDGSRVLHDGGSGKLVVFVRECGGGAWCVEHEGQKQKEPEKRREGAKDWQSENNAMLIGSLGDSAKAVPAVARLCSGKVSSYGCCRG